MRTTVLSLAAAVAAMTACSDDPVQPVLILPTAPTRAIQATGASVVEFNGPVRRDFAARIASLGGTVDFVVPSVGFARVSGLRPAAVDALQRSNGIAAVYDDVPLQVGSPARGGEALEIGATPMSTTNPAGAFLFGALQWNMRAINAPAAWAAGALGSANVTAAIIDTGLDYDNLDLNGLVDLSRSVSFVASDDALLGALFPTRNKIDDLVGHGTIIATQVSSNAAVFAGVSSRTRLLGIKVVGATGGSLSGLLAGLVWAADHGADVANVSLGIENGFDKAGAGLLVGIFNRVFNYANRAGMVIVVAAGNDARNLDGDGRVYAAFCESPHVVCVSATGPTSGTPFAGPWGNVDAPASYSDIGKNEIAVSAPGGSEFGFVSALCARHFIEGVGQSLTFPCNVSLPAIRVLGGAGTSGAAPHVTGVVAQLIAKYGKGNPSQIKQLLLNGVDDLGAPGNDALYGYGRVNLLKAVSQ
jgi:subtilisin family serine protease